MPTVIDELVTVLSYQSEDKDLDAARTKAKSVAEAIADGFRKAADEIEGSNEDVAESAEESAKKTSEVWKGALREIGATVTRFGVDAIKSFAEFGAEAIQRTATMARFADKVGKSASEISALVEAGEDLNINADNTQEAIKTLNENLGELARIGTGPARDALGSLGLRLEDIKDLDAEDQLKVLADALVDVEDPAKQLSIAIEVMGEDGAQLLPLLLQGAEGIDAMTAAARESGRVMTDETIAASLELDQTLNKVKGQVEGVALQLLEALIPQITEAASGAADWIAENEELIQQDLPEVFSGIADAVGGLVEVLGAAVQKFAEVRRAAIELADTMADNEDLIALGEAQRRGEITAGSALASTRRVGTRGVAGLSTSGPASEQVIAARERVRQEQRANEAARQQLANEKANQRETARIKRAAEAEQRRRRANKFERSERAAAAGGGGGGESAELRQGRQDVELTGLQAEFQKLADKFGATDKALAEAIKSAATSFSRGASQSVARKAGLSTLGGLVGVDLNKLPTSDPLLSEIFGVEGLPDAPISDLTGNRTPQVLTATITNTFTIEQRFNIDGHRRPDLVPDQVQDAMRSLFSQVEQSSRFAKVVYER